MKHTRLMVPLTDYYTLSAVGQDDFGDVKVPDTPQKPATKQ